MEVDYEAAVPGIIRTLGFGGLGLVFSRGQIWQFITVIFFPYFSKSVVYQHVIFI